MLNILTEQPNYLLGDSKGGSDTALYSAWQMENYRSSRDVLFTHTYQNKREVLDHVLASQEFYDNSRNRIWSFKGLDIVNDHLNDTKHHKDDGTTDHGILSAAFEYRPAK